MTIEASGIAPAIMTGYLMDLPVVFAKKKSPRTIQNALSTTVHSFTKDRDYEVVISSDFLTPKDNVLFVDDFLAYGNAALGVIDLIKQSGANLVGMGFIIEKAFQNGRKTLEERGVRVSCHHRRFIQLPDYNKRLTIQRNLCIFSKQIIQRFFHLSIRLLLLGGRLM